MVSYDHTCHLEIDKSLWNVPKNPLTISVQDRPVIITGDFNGPPSEPMFSTMTNNDKLPLNSSYDTEPNSWTTWKIRDTGEEKYILDYIFHSPELKALRVLETPDEESVGADRSGFATCFQIVSLLVP